MKELLTLCSFGHLRQVLRVRWVLALCLSALCSSRATAQALEPVEPLMRELTARHYALTQTYTPVLTGTSPITWGGWPNNAAGQAPPDVVPDGFYTGLVSSGGYLTATGVAVTNAIQAAYEGLKYTTYQEWPGRFIDPSTVGGVSDPESLTSSDFHSAYPTATTSSLASTVATYFNEMAADTAKVVVWMKPFTSWTEIGPIAIDRYVHQYNYDSCTIGNDAAKSILYSQAPALWVYETSYTGGGFFRPHGWTSGKFTLGPSCGGGNPNSTYVLLEIGQLLCPMKPDVDLRPSGISPTVPGVAKIYIKVSHSLGPPFNFGMSSLGGLPPVPAGPWGLAATYPVGSPPALVGRVLGSGYALPSSHSYAPWLDGWIVTDSVAIVEGDFRLARLYNGYNSLGVDAIRPGSPSGLLGEGDLEGEMGQNPESCAPVSFASGHKSESAIDLSVAATGQPFQIEREYTSEYGYVSQSDGNLVGNGWMLSAFKSVSVSGSGTGRVITLFGPPMDRYLVFTNPDPSGNPEVWSSGGPASQRLIRTTLDVDGQIWPTWRLIEPGGGSIDFYRTVDSGETGVQTPATAVVGMVLQERDSYGNPRTYSYQLPDPGHTQALRARLRAVYVNGTPRSRDTEAEVLFTWHFQSGAMNGKLDKVEVQRRVGVTNSFVTTQSVDYTYAAEGSGWHSSIGSGDDLVQVTARELVDRVPADSPAPDPYHVEITQYRYHNGGAVATSGTDQRLLIDGAAGQLKLVIQPEQVEWYAQQRGPSTSWSAKDTLANAAAELLTKAETNALESPVSSLSLVDLASKIIDYENATGGKVVSEFLQTACGCGGGSTQGVKHEFVYSSSYTAGSGKSGKTTKISEKRGTGVGTYESSPYRVTYYDLEWLGSTGSTVPYLVTKAILEPGVRVWAWRSDYDSDRNLIRSTMPSGCQSYQSYEHSGTGIPVYTAASTGVSHSFTYTNNRLSESRVGTPGATGDLVSKVTYDSTGAVPPHLPTKVEKFRTNSSSPTADEVETTTFTYGFMDETGVPTVAKRYPVAWTKTSVESELLSENGPDSATTYDSYELFDSRGRNFWSRAADKSLTHRAFDPVTGGVTQITRNADPSAPAGNSADAIPATHAGQSTAGWGTIGSTTDVPRIAGGELVTTLVYDKLGRLVRTVSSPGASPTRPGVVGASAYIVRGLAKLPGQSAGPYFYSETSLPHRLVGSPVEHSGPATVSIFNAGGKVMSEVAYAVDGTASYDPTAASPVYTLQSTLLTRRIVSYHMSGMPNTERVWHAIKQSDLSENAFSHTKSYTYDALGRVSSVTDFDGTLTSTDYDVLDRPIKTYLGTNTSNLIQTNELYYDTSTSSPAHTGVGDGNLVVEREYVGPSSGGEPLAPAYFRDTLRTYDARNRLVKVVGPTAPYQFMAYDNLDRPTEAAASDGSLGVPSSMSSLSTDRKSYSRTFYSQRGLVYKQDGAINPDNGSPSFLSTYTWYDSVGRSVAQWGPNGSAVKTTYDGLGRVIATYATDRGGDAAPAASGTLSAAQSRSGDTVFSESRPVYGESGTRHEGRHLMDRSFERIHSATLTGDLDHTNAVVTYKAYYFDDADRVIRTVDFGTHRSEGVLTTGAATDQPVWPPSSPPSHSWTDPNCSSCQAPAVAAVSFNTRGLVESETDPLNRVTRYIYDDLDRRGVTIENSVSITGSNVSWDRTAGDWTISSLSNSAATDQDRISMTLYDGGGRAIQSAMYASNGTGTPSTPYKQTTKYIYGTSVGSYSDYTHSLVASNGLLTEVQYPSESTGAVSPSDNTLKVRYAYNIQGELRSVTDQNGTRHVFRRDAAGREVSDTVEALGSNLDNTVKRLAYTYDGMGRPSKATSLDQITPSDNIINEVQYSYTPMGQVERVYQNPDGAVTFDGSGNPTGTTVAIRHGYTSTSTAASNNYLREETLTYPDGTAVNYAYDKTGQSNTPESKISRLVRLEVAGSPAVPLVEYTHLGLSTVALADFSTPRMKLDATINSGGVTPNPSTGYAGTRYPGFDYRGRLSRTTWTDYGYGPGTGSNPNQPPLFLERFDYDKMNRTRRVDERVGRVWADRDAEWQFDGLDRMKLEKRGVYGSPWTYAGAASPFKSRDFAPDALGNWLSTAVDLDGSGTFGSGERETRTFNQANELLSRSIPWSPATTVADTYDDNGNLRTVATTVSPPTTSTTTYTHDAWNRLVTYDKDSVAGFTVRYYALHWRAKVLQPTGAEVRQFYDASWRLLEVRNRSSSGGADSFNHTFYGKRHIDDVVAHRVDTGTLGSHSDDTTYWHVTDGQFSTRAIVKPSGGSTASILMERVDYDAYGLARHHYPGDTDGDGDYDATDNATITSLNAVTINGGSYNVEADLNRDGVIDSTDVTLAGGAGGTTYKTALSSGVLTGSAGNNFGFGGYVYNAATGFYLVRNRWYDPNTGRWIQRDPAGYVDGLNLYEYCQGGPWDGLDPLGMWKWDRDWVETFLNVINPIPTRSGLNAKAAAAQGAAEGAWNLMKGAAFSVAEVAGIVYDVGGVPVECVGVYTGLYDYRHDYASHTMEAYGQGGSMGEMARNGAMLGGRTLAAGVTLGGSEVGIATYNGLVTGDYDAMSQHLGGVALWNTVPLAISKGVPSRPTATQPYSSQTWFEHFSAKYGTSNVEWMSTEPALLRPYGGPGGGHHLPSKRALEGSPRYNGNAALALPNEEMARLGVNHAKVTGAQASGYRAFAKTGNPLTWKVMTEIEAQSLVHGGMHPAKAMATAKAGVQSLKDAGVPGPVRIPWGGQ